MNSNCRHPYQEVLKHFPDGIIFACAYGSAIFKQTGHNSLRDNVIDFIFVVDDTLKWHRENIQKHPGHYSFMKSFGSKTISSLQEDFGAGIYFNTLVKFDDRLIKYGVISHKCFHEDLVDWTSMYISGRLHKPVMILHGVEDKRVTQSQNRNLDNAIRCSLLCLPQKFRDKELFLEIAGLSYAGDFRMVIGEDKQKIQNIVIPNINNFRNLYKKRLNQFAYVGQDNYVEQDLSVAVQVDHLRNLPKAIKLKVFDILGYANCPKEQGLELFNELGRNKEKTHGIIKKATSSVVRYSSITQSLKGILTAGISKSAIYSGQKLQKMLRSIIK